MRRHLGLAGAVLFLLGATGFLFAPLLRSAVTEEQRFLEWDVPEQYWPDLVYLCGALHEGDLPSWNPYDRGGYPYYADPQSGAYHPLNWMICAAAGSSPSLAWAELRVFLGFFLAGLFGLLWLRRLGLPLGAAVLGAVAIEAAPFMRHNWELNLTTALAFAPLMLWMAERAAVERRPRDGALLGLAAGLCAWVGSPPALWFASTFTAAYFLARWLAEARSGGSVELLRGALTAAVAAAVAAGFTLVVLIPGAGLAQHSVQTGTDFDSITAGGLSPSELIALLAPQPGNHLYMGLIVLALAPLAFLGRGQGSKALAGRWFHLAMALAAVSMTLGAQGPLFRLAFDWIPGVAVFRLPHRYEAWLGPALGALAAAGLVWLSTERPAAVFRGHRRALRALAAALVVTAPLVLFLWSELSLGVALLLLAAGIVLTAATLPQIGPAHLLVGVLLSSLLLVDLSQQMPEARHTRRGPHPDGVGAAATTAVLERAPETEQEYRYFDEFGISCRSGTRLERRDFRGYQDPLLLKAYERVIAALEDHPRLLEQFNVRYILTGPHFIHGWNRHYLPPPRELLELEGTTDRGRGAIELPEPLPIAYWVPRTQVEMAEDRPAALRRLLEVAPAPVALLDGAITGPEAPDGGPFEGLSGSSELSRATAVDLRRDRLSFRIDAPGPGVVVVNEVWYPGWRAEVDGEARPIYRVNALVRGLFVDAGEHRVEMVFRPRDGGILRWLLVATWLLFVALMAWSLRPNRAGAAP